MPSSSWEACRQASKSLVFPSRSIATCQLVSPARVPLTVWGQLSLSRGFAATSKLRPKHIGGKLKLSGGYKERFKLTASGELQCISTSICADVPSAQQSVWARRPQAADKFHLRVALDGEIKLASSCCNMRAYLRSMLGDLCYNGGP